MRTLWLPLAVSIMIAAQPQSPARKTIVSIEGQDFLLNGRPTYAGRSFERMPVQGLLFNSRMVQGIFDDRNPETRARWNYPDGPWDADRNTREFVNAMPLWRAKGLLAFTINLQGGSPEGYSRSQPWINSAFETDGTLRPDYMSRLERILDRADGKKRWAELGPRVRETGRHLGAFADFFASHVGAQEITLEELRHAMTMVRADCTVRSERTPVAWEFCPHAPVNIHAAREYLLTIAPAPELVSRAG